MTEDIDTPKCGDLEAAGDAFNDKLMLITLFGY
ncbi:hypothetical protein ACVWXO_001034 [Bradyrhizobium sp. LM2.7]